MATKKPRKANHTELLKSHNSKDMQRNYSIFRFIGHLITNLSIGKYERARGRQSRLDDF